MQREAILSSSAPVLRSKRVHALAEAVRAFTEAVPDYDEIPHVVTEQTARLTGDVCTMRLLTEDGRRLEPVAGYHPDAGVLADTWDAMRRTVETIDSGVWLGAIQGRRPIRLLFNRAEAQSEAAPVQLEFARKYLATSVIAAPLLARGRVLGGIALTRLGGRPPHSAAEMDLIADLASRAALAVDNARLMRDVHRAEELLRTANEELSARLVHLDRLTAGGRAFAARVPDLRGLGEAVVEYVATCIGDGCTLWIAATDEGDNRLSLLACHHRDASVDGVLRDALEPTLSRPTATIEPGHGSSDEARPVHRISLSAEQVLAQLRPAFRGRAALLGPALALVAPLRARDRDVGLLVVSRKKRRGEYADADVAFLRDLADSAALTLDNARLYQAAQAELGERKRVEISLRTRNEQQTALLQLHRAVLEGADLQTLYDATVTLSARLLEAERAALFLTSSDGEDQLQVGALVGWSDPREVVGLIGEQVRRSIELRDAVVVPDASAQVPPAWQAHGLTGGLSVVVPGTDWLTVRGVLAVHCTTDRLCTPEDAAFLESLSTVVGGAIARQQYAAGIHDREQALRALIENTPDIISRWDRNLRRIYVNPAIERATGRPASDFIGRTSRELGMPMSLVDRWEMATNQVFRTGREQIIETAYETPDGERQYETRITPELAADGTVATVLSVGRDITEQRRADLDRRALVEEVLQRESRLQELVSRMITDQARDARRALGSLELDRLTRREREILHLVVTGQTNGQIALALGLSVGTVKNHVARLLPKLGATDRTQAAVRAVEYGLLESS
jgi:PAS domain S-box-containing protein